MEEVRSRVTDKKNSAKGEVAVYKFYKVEDNNVIRIKRDCPRCGRGVFMAEHKDRNTCGKCGYTEFKHKDLSKKANKKS